MPRGRKATDETNGEDQPEQMALNFDKKTATELLEEILGMKQDMDDARMALAGKYKEFEDAGGDRRMVKIAIRFKKQDISKTISELRAFDTYRDWWIQPLVEAQQQASAE